LRLIQKPGGIGTANASTSPSAARVAEVPQVQLVEADKLVLGQVRRRDFPQPGVDVPGGLLAVPHADCLGTEGGQAGGDVRNVAVHVLQAHQQRAAALGGGQHAPLQRREALQPLRIGSVQALVHHRSALRGAAGQIKVGRVRRAPADPVRQPRWPVPRYCPHRQASSGQACREGTTDLPGA
jgi:hypothetical protein